MHDDQFTATGPPRPASAPGFESSGFSTQPEAGFQFGLRVIANRCGVMGQTSGGGVAGVYGHGRFSQTGVLGTGFGARTGVIGASIDNSNDLMNLNVAPGSVTLESLGTGSGTGVHGRSGSGLGVHGLSVENTGVFGSSRSGFGCHGDSGSNTAVFGSSRTGIGCHGDSGSNTAVFGSSGSGFGVHGQSGTGPGGFFSSQDGVQLHVEPRDMGVSPEGVVGGAGGDLLATRASGPAGPEVRLWFCSRPGDAATARWDLVAGTRPFPGQHAEGSSGVGVKRIQMRLNMITGTQLNGDGEFGAITRDAVAAFQEREGLPADGVVDERTWVRLFDLS